MEAVLSAAFKWLEAPLLAEAFSTRRSDIAALKAIARAVRRLLSYLVGREIPIFTSNQAAT
jgi:hypothetical protein